MKIYLVPTLLLGCFFSVTTIAQAPFALSTGNYAGVTGVWFNPSSIADSRHKFDINLFSNHSYFDNNLLDVKGDALYRGLFFREPYNSDFDEVRSDLLSLRNEPANSRVNAFVTAEVQAPLSMMVTTGQKSAIALNFRSRIGMQVFNMSRSTAQLLYAELNDPALHGIIGDNSGLEVDQLRWQEVGFTYSRVLLNTGKHFVKGGFTGKWLMGQAAAHIQSDNLNVAFNSPTLLSIQSPLIRYYRSEQADINKVRINNFFQEVEDHQFGWDAGITYEYRGRIKAGSFESEPEGLAGRRDLNKYTFRLAAAIVDVGKFTFQKEPLTNDHSANFNNWDFSNVKASSFGQFDQAYAQQVQYSNGTSNNFAMALPTALSTNIDLHLVRGFYLNAAMYLPLDDFNRNVQTAMRAAEWYAVTPRWESRHFGIYIPYVYSALHHRDNLGLTLRMGPVFVGSSNMGSLLFKQKLPSVDVHAGVKFGITYGKKSKVIEKLESIIKPKKDSTAKGTESTKYYLDDARMRGLDSLLNLSKDSIAANVVPVAPTPMPPPPVVSVVVNNYMAPQAAITAAPDSIRVRHIRDSIVVGNVMTPTVAAAPLSPLLAEKDSLIQRRDREIDILLNQMAALEIDRRYLQAQRNTDSAAIDVLLQERRRLEERLQTLSDQVNLFEQRYNEQELQKKAPPDEKQDSWFKRLFRKKDN